eukprot:353425-Chlamydomonas_euryale.AAC.2
MDNWWGWVKLLGGYAPRGAAAEAAAAPSPVLISHILLAVHILSGSTPGNSDPESESMDLTSH